MADDNVNRLMGSLGLDYSKAITSTENFAQSIGTLDKQLIKLKSAASQTAKDVNAAFSLKSGSGASTKTIVDQYGKAFKTVQVESKKTSASLKDNAKYIKQSTFEQMKAQAASVQQRATTKKLSEDYSTQAKLIRKQTAELQKKLELSGKLSAEEVKQTQNLQEQLAILKQQTSAGVSDDIRTGKGRASEEWDRRTSWFLSGTMFYGMINSGKEAVTTIKDVEMGMIEIARIMDDSTFSFKDYRDQLMQLGIDYGQTFETVQDIALRWAQAGYNVKDSLELTKTALLALNTAELDAANATDSMVGIMAQWGLQASDLELVIDKINKIADDYTVSSQDLVDGLLRSSSAAKNMSMSIEDTIALLTVMREASGRTGKEVGSALNSILSYIQRPKSIDVLESMGITVFTDKTKQNFRNAMDLFRDIAANWKNTSDEIKDGFVQSADDAGLFNEELAEALGLQEEWNDLNRRDIAQASAGVYRRNYFIGMIERMANTQGVLNNMMDAGGYSARENENTMDSLEKKYKSLKASVEQLMVALGDAGLLDIFKSGVDLATKFANSLSDMDDRGRALLLTALELVTTFTALKAVGGMTGFDISIAGMGKGLQSIFSTAEKAAPGWLKLIPLIGSVVAGLGLYIHNAQKSESVTSTLAERQEKLSNSYNNQQESIQKTKDEMNAQAETAERLAGKMEELTNKENLNVTEKAQMKTIVKQLNDIFPSLSLAIDEQTGKVIGNTSAIYDNIAALKEQVIQQARASQMQATAEQFIQQESLAGDAQNALDAERSKLAKLQTSPVYYEILEAQNKSERYGWSTIHEGEVMMAIEKKYGEKNIRKQINDTKKNIDALTDQASIANSKLQQLDNELDRSIDKTQEASGDSVPSAYTPPTYTPSAPASAPKSSSSGPSSPKASATYKNEALTEELKQLDFKKSINAITTENEIAELERIKAAHVKTNDEIMDMDKRLYSARKALTDETFQNSTTWISDQKSLDKLSADEEIAAWERVKNNQVDNAEAVKQATVNLYKLRKQQSEDAAKAEESSIKHLTNLGIYSVEEQIKAYKNLYSVRAALSADEEQARVENLFNLYKQLLGEQQEKIKEAYDERIKMIEEEAKADKAKAQERIKDLQEELNLLDKQDAQRSYEQNIADIKKDIKYWEVRTSLDADKNEKEAREKLKEEQYKHELELQKDSINGKIDDLEDEVKDIDRLADEEKERWEKSYKLTEKAFDTHSVNIIAMAGAMSEEAYSKWEQNYLIPLQNALKSNDFSTFDGLSSRLGNSVNGLDTGRKDNKNAQIYNAANTILNLKKQWIDGNHTAADQAKQYYRTLRNLGTKGSRIADQLDAADYHTAQNIVNNLPRYHTGRLNGMEEVAVIRKDELIFPPELSRGIRALFPVISNLGKHGASYDNRKEIKIDKLVNIENNHMEDNLDERSFARELNRTLNAII